MYLRMKRTMIWIVCGSFVIRGTGSEGLGLSGNRGNGASDGLED